MNIAFITGGLCPGRNGVGDYTRRLAAECIRLGHSSTILGINDHQVSRTTSEHQEIEGSAVSVPTLRLPHCRPWLERLPVIRRELKNFNPDWISLQYVCYAFHPKGLAWRANLAIEEIGNLARFRHLMLHELWIGEGGYTTPWRQLVGVAQRNIIRNMHRRFHPNIATTSTGLFQRRLSRRGIISGVLPIFGNIPIALRDDERIARLLSDAGSRTIEKNRNAFLGGVFFGGVHSDFDAAPLIRWLKALPGRSDRSTLLIFIGRAGAKPELLAKQLLASLPEGLEVVFLGEQSAKIISQTLQFADFGINTGAPEFLGKSGTFAAMQEHDLPVVLGEGQLDVADYHNETTPVCQFSSPDSAAAIINYERQQKEVAGASRRAADLIRRFEAISCESTQDQRLIGKNNNNRVLDPIP